MRNFRLDVALALALPLIAALVGYAPFSFLCGGAVGALMTRWPAVAPTKNLPRAIVASTLLWVLGGVLGLVLLSVASGGYRIVPVLFVVIAFIGLVLALTTLLLKVSATQSRT